MPQINAEQVERFEQLAGLLPRAAAAAEQVQDPQLRYEVFARLVAALDPTEPTRHAPWLSAAQYEPTATTYGGHADTPLMPRPTP